MYIVGIYDLKKDKETLADPLISALGVTRYEAMSRLRTPGEGPLIVSVLAAKEQAMQLADKLSSLGFSSIVIVDEDIEAENRSLIVRQFTFRDKDLIVEAGNIKLNVPFSEIDLILRGTGIASSISTETVKEKSFNLGRAVLTQGLITSKTTKSVREVTSEEREGFVNLYYRDSPALVFLENSLAYDSLGTEIKISRKENFSYLVAEFRRLCSGAKYDERLLTRPAQVGMLGPVLSPEKNLSVATALLAKVLRGRA